MRRLKPFDLFQESAECSQHLQIIRGYAIGIKVHHIIPDHSDAIQVCAEGHPIECEAELLPSVRILQNPEVFAKRKPINRRRTAGSVTSL